MYVTDKYVFVHMNKCAGVFVKDFIIKNFPTKIKVYKHAPLRCIREEDRKKKILGVIRNPFSWYVSFYHYHRENGYYTKLSFAEYIKCHLQNSRKLISKAQKKNVLDKNAKIYPPETKLNIGSFTFHFINFFAFKSLKILRTWTDEQLENSFSNICKVYLMRQENLKETMIDVFGEQYRGQLANMPKKNISQHGHYSKYYTSELVKMVEEKEKLILQYYGYKFEQK